MILLPLILLKLFFFVLVDLLDFSLLLWISPHWPGSFTPAALELLGKTSDLINLFLHFHSFPCLLLQALSTLPHSIMFLSKHHTKLTIKVNILYYKYNAIAAFVYYNPQLILESFSINIEVLSTQRFLA